MTHHTLHIALVQSQQTNLRTALLASRTSLEAEITSNPTDRNLITELAMLNNVIALGDFEAAQDVPI